MKEDLGFYGNELVHFQTIYTAGAVVGQIPFLFLLTHIPMHYAIPSLDILWGVVTLLQYRTKSYLEMMVYRFLVGWFEVLYTACHDSMRLTLWQAAFFPSMHYVFGSWYRSSEIARRGCFWYSAQNVGTLTASLIQAGASSHLDGVYGLAGWRWMYIICSIITIPVGLVGFFVFPGTPDRPNRLVLRQRDIDLAIQRLTHAGHNTTERLSIAAIKRVCSSKRTWIFLVLDLSFWNASLNIVSGGFLLWLKSLQRYSAARINTLGSITPALGILYNLIIGVASDLWIGPAWAITAAHTWNIIGLIILVIWTVPESALWFAFMTTYSSNCISAVLYGWINSALRHSPAERSFTIVFVNMLAQSVVAWVPLLTFETVEAPRFTKGYSYVLGNAVCFIALAHLVRRFLREKKMYLPLY
jgi:hypothetical protein